MTGRVRLVAAAAGPTGRGHVGRMLALGAALTERGAPAAIEVLAGKLTEGERRRALAYGLTPAGEQGDEIPDVVVIDVPDPRPVAHRFPRARLVVLDDRDQFAGRAAVVVQPSQAAWRGGGDADVVLAGYRYVPIDPVYRRLRESAVSDGGAPAARRMVIMCFGGSDPADVTHRIAPWLTGLTASLTVVLGASYRGSGAGEGVTVLRDPADLAERLAAADLAIVGAGTMKFEVACLGLPAVLLAVADDQLAVGPPYGETGAALYLGDGRTIDPGSVAVEVGRLLDDEARRVAMASAAARLVDGRGADRIADAILSLNDDRRRGRRHRGAQQDAWRP